MICFFHAELLLHSPSPSPSLPVCVYMRACACVYARARVCVCVRMYVCVHVSMCVGVCACVSMCMRACVWRVHVCACVCGREFLGIIVRIMASVLAVLICIVM